jgi:hypothetical protein
LVEKAIADFDADHGLAFDGVGRPARASSGWGRRLCARPCKKKGKKKTEAAALAAALAESALGSS